MQVLSIRKLVVDICSWILLVTAPGGAAFLMVSKSMCDNTLNCVDKFYWLVFVLVNTICEALNEVAYHFL